MDSRMIVAAVCGVVILFCACAEGLICAGCPAVPRCDPVPAGCAISREPCGCCDVCALQMGDRCHGYSAGCGPGLVCLTPIGPFPQRPPEDSKVHGRCVMAPTPVPPTVGMLVPPTIAPTPAPSMLAAVGKRRK